MVREKASSLVSSDRPSDSNESRRVTGRCSAQGRSRRNTSPRQDAGARALPGPRPPATAQARPRPPPQDRGPPARPGPPRPAPDNLQASYLQRRRRRPVEAPPQQPRDLAGGEKKRALRGTQGGQGSRRVVGPALRAAYLLKGSPRQPRHHRHLNSVL